MEQASNVGQPVPNIVETPSDAAGTYGGIPICVQLLNGESIELEVSEDVTALKVKHQVADQIGCAVSHQRLLFQEVELADSLSLVSYGIGPGSILSLLLVTDDDFKLSKLQHPLVGKVLAAMKLKIFHPSSEQFDALWEGHAAPEIGDDEFNALVTGACAVDACPRELANFVRILGFWFSTAEPWNMLNHQHQRNFDPGLQHFRHELYLELVKQASASASSVANPRLACVFHVDRHGNVNGFELVGDEFCPFTRLLRSALHLARHAPMTILAEFAAHHLLRSLWHTALLGHRHAARDEAFTGAQDFNPADWVGYRSSSEMVTVHRDDVLPLLHLQTQLSAGIFPVVMHTKLDDDHACLVANASGFLLKAIRASGSLNVQELQISLRKASIDNSKDVLAVVTGLHLNNHSLYDYSKLCRIREELHPWRFHLILCVQEP